jgi:hypothetical protein
MGERGVIVVRQDESDAVIVLYTHWTGDQVEYVVKQTLSRVTRWDDPGYLTRMLFCELVGIGDWDGSMGFAIQLHIPDDLNYDPVLVDVPAQAVWRVRRGIGLGGLRAGQLLAGAELLGHFDSIATGGGRQ